MVNGAAPRGYLFPFTAMAFESRTAPSSRENRWNSWRWNPL